LATTRAIIAAALQLFLQRGYEGTSTDAVAAAVPVSKRTLYNHFPNKASLFEAVISSSWSWLLSPGSEFLATARPDSRDAAAAMLTEYGRSVLTHWEKPEVTALIRLVIAEANRFPETAGAFFEYGKRPALDRLTDFLARVSANGLAQVGDPAIAAWQFHGMLKEPVFLPRALGLPAPFDSEAVVASAVRRALLLPECTTDPL
jgi:TetR/AcrR family transcriptional regulator, regulator of autoinduction and epiphytic fitness